jgi:heme A synthase
MDNPSARRTSVAARVRYGLAEHGPGPLLALAAILTDGAVGVGLHFEIIPFRLHLWLSVATTTVVVWAGVQAIRRNLDTPAVRRAALLLLSLTFSQVLAGVGSYMNLLAAGTLVWFPIAHTAVGVAALGSAVALTAAVYRRMRPEDAELAHGGVAIA